MTEPLDARGGAIWNDGHPVNLRAAAWDALDWIDVLMKHAAYIRMPAEDLRRLKASRFALVRELRRQPYGVLGMEEPKNG